MYRPGDIFYTQYTTTNISGVSTNADSLPLGVLVRNGVDDSSPKIFINNVDVGRYTVSGVIPSTYVKGNSVNVVVSGYMGGALQKLSLGLGQLDSMYVGDILTTPGITVSVTGVANANVITFSGIPVAAPDSSGCILSDLRFINGVQALSYNGIARSGGTNWVQLSASEPATDQYYQWQFISLVGGQGVGQWGFITSYSGSTQTAYISNNWHTLPYNNSQYSFGGLGLVNSEYIQDQALGTKVGTNFNTFFQNAGNTTTNIIDNVASGTDWSTTERSQIRYKLGIDGSSSPPATPYAGQLELSLSGVHNIMVENGINMNQWMEAMGAVIAGSSTVNGNNITYYAMNNNGVQRVNSTAVSGSRQAIVLLL